MSTTLTLHRVTQILLHEVKSLPNPYRDVLVVYRTIEICHGDGQITAVILHAQDSQEACVQVVPATPATPVPEAA
jgi:hypothetical protein